MRMENEAGRMKIVMMRMENEGGRRKIIMMRMENEGRIFHSLSPILFIKALSFFDISLLSSNIF